MAEFFIFEMCHRHMLNGGNASSWGFYTLEFIKFWILSDSQRSNAVQKLHFSAWTNLKWEQWRLLNKQLEQILFISEKRKAAEAAYTMVMVLGCSVNFSSLRRVDGELAFVVINDFLWPCLLLLRRIKFIVHCL